MKEELTEAMHAEFTIDAESELKEKYWAAFDSINDGMSVEDVIQVFGVTDEGLKKYLSEYNELFSEKVFLK